MGYVYLIRHGDLNKIGRKDNIFAFLSKKHNAEPLKIGVTTALSIAFVNCPQTAHAQPLHCLQLNSHTARQACEQAARFKARQDARDTISKQLDNIVGLLKANNASEAGKPSESVAQLALAMAPDSYASLASFSKDVCAHRAKHK